MSNRSFKLLTLLSWSSSSSTSFNFISVTLITKYQMSYLLLYSQNVWYYNHEDCLPNSLYSSWAHTTKKTNNSLLFLDFIPVVSEWSAFLSHAYISVHIDSDCFNGSVPATSKATNNARSNLIQKKQIERERSIRTHIFFDGWCVWLYLQEVIESFSHVNAYTTNFKQKIMKERSNE